MTRTLSARRQRGTGPTAGSTTTRRQAHRHEHCMTTPIARPAAAASARTRAPAVAYISWVAPGHDDDQLGGEPALRADDGGLRPGGRLPLPRAGASSSCCQTSLGSAELASGWNGGVYKWVSEGISKPMGFLAVWCQFAMTIFYYPTLLGFVASTLGVRHQPGPREQRGLDGARSSWSSTGPVSGSPPAGTKGHRRSGQRRTDHRHADPRRRPGHPRRRVPRPGQPVGGTHGRRAHPARVGRPGEPGADRQQLPVVLRHGDERGARRPRCATPPKEFPKAMFTRDGAGPGHLHPAGTGHQLVRARRRSSP